MDVQAPQPLTHPYRLSAWFFIRFLGIIYLIAFASLGNQVLGLIGSKGLLPATQYLQAVNLACGFFEQFWRVPTLFWIADGDIAFMIGVWSGLVFSVLLILNIAPRYCLILLWVLYLSFVSIGQDFFSFQWDNLLLETGFLTIFLAPSHFYRGEKGEKEPSRLARWLLLWLLFRFHIESGLSKLLSGDETWRNLTAMNYYYETAPIPTWLGWWTHQLPRGFQAMSVLGTFFVELVMPFLLFAPRNYRYLAAILLIALQIFIGLTANYTFFNLLTISLCLLVFDDIFWCRWMKGLERIRKKLLRATSPPIFRVPKALCFCGFGWIILISIFNFTGRYYNIPFVRDLISLNAPLRSINGYGLFAVMTRQRWELEIQGSLDGITWKTHAFRYKPGDLKCAPPFVAPYQPRLDFQCWFLTFDGGGDFRRNRYLISLLEGICSNNSTILRLLAENPFGESSPQYLRLKVNRYEMTSIAERHQTGCYWKMIESRPWSPVMKCGTGN